MRKICLAVVLMVLLAGSIGQRMTFSTVSQQAGWYWKPAYPNYAPSGVPDFDQKQDNWMNIRTGQWSFCGPTAVANCFWWFDSKHADPAGTPGDGLDSFPLVSDYGAPNPRWGPDDHDPSNVDDLATPWLPGNELVERLAWCMDTDGVRTESHHGGTLVYDMDECIDDWLLGEGLQDTLSVRTVERPSFEWVEEEVLRSQGIILLLGFWEQQDGEWRRLGGHYVTVAGVHVGERLIAISDPFKDVACPSSDPLMHNDSAFVSRDTYTATIGSDSPGGEWQLGGYEVGEFEGFESFFGQNFASEEQHERYGGEWQGGAILTEVEYAVEISPVVSHEAVALTATEDAGVSEARPTANSGADETTWVASGPGSRARFYLKFDLGEVPKGVSIVSSTLWAYCWAPPMDGDRIYGVHYLEDDTLWTETTITWNNAPPFTAFPSSGQIIWHGPEQAPYARWYGWSVKDDVIDALRTDGVLTEVLIDENESGPFDRTEWYTDEAVLPAGPFRPYLVVFFR